MTNSIKRIDLAIVRAEENDIADCSKLIFYSEIGSLYYPQLAVLESQLHKAVANEELYTAKSIDKCLFGCLWFLKNGAFYHYPYLHFIVVASEYRHLGAGQQMLDFFEQFTLINGKHKLRTKVFLLVADINTKAARFYENNGYIKVGKIDALFRKSIDENLMMKTVIRKPINKENNVYTS